MKNKLLYVDKSQISGVQGWLLLICISMIVSSGFGIYELVTKVEFKNIDLFGIILIVLGYAPLFYVLTAGILLWFVKKDALKHARIAIIINMVSSTILVLIMLIIMLFINGSFENTLLPGFIVIVRSVLILIYLNKSVRVKNTYIGAV